jgi:hypothetical protein
MSQEANSTLTLGQLRSTLADKTSIPKTFGLLMQQQQEQPARDDETRSETSSSFQSSLPTWFHYTETNHHRHHLNEHATEAFNLQTVRFIIALQKKNDFLHRITNSDIGRWINDTTRAFYDKNDAQQQVDATTVSMKSLKKDAEKQDRIRLATDVSAAKKRHKAATESFNTLNRTPPHFMGANSDTLRIADIQMLTTFDEWMPAYLKSESSPFYQLTTVAKMSNASFSAEKALVPFDAVTLAKRRAATGNLDALCSKTYATPTQYLKITFWITVDRKPTPPPMYSGLQPAYFYFQQTATIQYPDLSKSTVDVPSPPPRTDTIHSSVAGIGTIYAIDANYGNVIFEQDRIPKDISDGCVPSMPTKRVVHAMQLLERCSRLATNPESRPHSRR